MSTAVDLSAVARVLGVKTEFVDLRSGGVVVLPQRIAVIAQGRSDSVYSLTKRRVTSAGEAGSVYGFGSPIHLAVRQLLPVNGDGVGTVPVTIYPLEDDANAEPAVAEITPTGSATETAAYSVTIGGIRSDRFVITTDDDIETICGKIADAVNSVVDMPVVADATATDVELTAKWAGESGNGITLEMDSADAGVDFALTPFSGGLVNPDIDGALAQFGEVWETFILNGLNAEDTDTLDALRTFGDGRWGALTRKPLVAFTGWTGTDINDAEDITDGRELDLTNSLIPAPGSRELPFVVAARALARIASMANNTPPHDYGSLRADGLEPGEDGEQWDYPTRDRAIKAGISTTIVRDSVITLQDIVTMYRPQAEPIPAYRYVVDIVKLQNVLFNIDLEFARPEWDGAPLIPDDDPTTERTAKKPKTARMAVGAITDNLALAAILSDPAFARANTVAKINPQNPKRLDLRVTVKLSGNTNILSVDLNFGFFFGTAQVVA